MRPSFLIDALEPESRFPPYRAAIPLEWSPYHLPVNDSPEMQSTYAVVQQPCC